MVEKACPKMRGIRRSKLLEFLRVPKSTTKTLENLMYTLHDMKGIVFLPIAEMSARKGY